MRKFVFAFLLALLLTTIVNADSPPGMGSFTEPTADGQSVCVMIVGEDSDRSKYSYNGLYTNTDSPELIYRVDWETWRIALSNNGDYVVRWGIWPKPKEYDALALAFYYQGQHLKSYKLSDLTQRFDRLKQNVIMIEWEHLHHLDINTNQLTVQLLSGENYVFDITTGEIINEFYLQPSEPRDGIDSLLAINPPAPAPIPQTNEDFSFLPISIFLFFIIVCLAGVWWVHKLRSDA